MCWESWLLLEKVGIMPSIFSLLLVSASSSGHSLACGCITLISVSIVTSSFSLGVCVFSFSVFYKDTSRWI